jgi:hypothetical protein
MNTVPRVVLGFLVGLLVFGLAVYAQVAKAQQKVDQGKPGTQGPWPVTYGTTADGGVIAFPVKFFCNGVKSGTTIVDGGTVANLPADGGLSGRWFIRVCTTGKNSGTPMIACTDDGQTPSMTFDAVGESIETSDCRTYYTPNIIKCVSDTALTAVTTEECK